MPRKPNPNGGAPQTVSDRLAHNVASESIACCLQVVIVIGRLDESFDASQQIPQWFSGVSPMAFNLSPAVSVLT